ncbi:MAG: DUF6776 family protein [Dokdonella sp.]
MIRASLPSGILAGRPVSSSEIATGMPSSRNPYVVHFDDVARQRRVRWLLGLIWLASLLCALGVGLVLNPEVIRDDSAAELEGSQQENAALKGREAMLKRSEQVARVALEDLQRTLVERQEEIAGLRADLAFYGRLVGGARREGLAIQAMRLRPVGDSLAWNFSVTLTQNIKRDKDVEGELSLGIDGIIDGKLTKLDWKTLRQRDPAPGIEYRFKYFQQVRGTVVLPEGFSPSRLHVRANGDGAQAEQDFDWAEAQRSEESSDVG